MPKNMGKGGKTRKRGVNKNDQQKRELTTKEEGQDYGQITKNLGGSRLEVLATDGTKRIGVIRGAIRRKMWIGVGDIVLVGVRDFEKDKVDILSRYTPEEAKQLIKEKHIPATMQALLRDDDEAHHGNVDFVANSSNDDDESGSEEEATTGNDRIAMLLRQAEDDEDNLNIDAI